MSGDSSGDFSPLGVPYGLFLVKLPPVSDILILLTSFLGSISPLGAEPTMLGLPPYPGAEPDMALLLPPALGLDGIETGADAVAGGGRPGGAPSNCPAAAAAAAVGVLLLFTRPGGCWGAV